MRLWQALGLTATTVSAACNLKCQNGGVCKGFWLNSHCVCENGFSGDLCEINDNPPADPCEFCENGECFTSGAMAFCTCNPGWSGENCDQGEPDCLLECNMGECTMDADGFHYCDCDDGWSGDDCSTSGLLHSVEVHTSTEVAEDPNYSWEGSCDPPCVNGAVCLNLGGGDFCECLTGFYGDQCQHNSFESSEPSCDLCVNGECLKLGETAYCNCYPGWTGTACDQSNQVIYTPAPTANHGGCTLDCKNGGKCVDMGTWMLCQCLPGFDGELCERGQNGYVAPCSKSCNFGQCVFDHGHETCECQSGYRGDDCSIKTTFTVGSIDDSGPGATGDLSTTGCLMACVYGDCVKNYGPQGSSESCVCSSGFMGTYCDIPIEDNFVCRKACQNGGVCLKSTTSDYCNCKNGFYGDLCEYGYTIGPVCDLNCGAHGTCTLSDNTMTCFCTDGYTGSDCQTPPSHTCVNGCVNGNCIDYGTFSICQCKPGWSGNACDQANDPCFACKNGKCSTVSGIAICSCDIGWMGPNCDFKIPDQQCKCKHGRCVRYYANQPWECSCDHGWIGETCSIKICMRGYVFDPKTDDCEPVIEPCTLNCNNGACRTTPGGPYCQCNDGWTGSDCNTRVGPSCPVPCQNGNCVYTGHGTSIGFCSCYAGWTGDSCSVRVNSGCHGGKSCLNGGSCMRSQTAAFCDCPAGWYGDWCESSQPPCKCKNGGTCHKTFTGSYCKCQDGFTGDNCEKIVPKGCPLPCENGGKCVLSADHKSIKCDCPDEFEGWLCTLKACQKNCNGGICKVVNGAETCDCQATGFEGPECLDPICTKECVNGDCKFDNSQMVCDCHTGWSGPKCNNKVYECSKTCHNGGTCEFKSDFSQSCKCVGDWTGPSCQEPVCTLQCENGGKCKFDGSNEMFCDCSEIIPNIWQGDLCDVSKCDLQCVHGGTCEWENNYQGKYCNCPAGYAGDFCQHDTSQDMCKVIGCDNGCECKRLDSSLINRHCEYNCDFECSNKNNTFHLGKRCQFAQPTLNCNSDSIVIEVQKDVVEDKWPLSKALVYNGLESTECGLVRGSNDVFHLSIQKSDFDKCGNLMDLIDGKLVITNRVFMDINLELLKLPSKLFNWECAYTVSTAKVALQPLMNPAAVEAVGENELKLKMRFYNKPYGTPGAMELSRHQNQVLVGKTVFVNIDLLCLDDKNCDRSGHYHNHQIILDRCMLTQSQHKITSSKDPRVEIIKNGCVNQDTPIAKVTKMGTNSMAEFMLHVVRWKNSAPVYLHCEVSLCENNCTPTCPTNRKKRALESRDQTKTSQIDQNLNEFSENENNDIFDDTVTFEDLNKLYNKQNGAEEYEMRQPASTHRSRFTQMTKTTTFVWNGPLFVIDINNATLRESN